MRQSATVILLFLLMFGVSSESHAFLEWLHKLSGPGPFVGMRLGCRFSCERGEEAGCRLIECGLGSALQDSRPKWTGNVGCAVARSYQNDLIYDPDTAAPKVWIWSIEPSLERWFRAERDVFFGVGYALTEFQGKGFDDFRRDAVTFRLGYRIDRDERFFHAIEIGAKYLVFEDRFTPEDFGARPGPTEPKGVFGLFTTLHFLR